MMSPWGGDLGDFAYGEGDRRGVELLGVASRSLCRVRREAVLN